MNDFSSGYVPVKQEYWTGRVDSATHYDAFRWHQWIQCIDIREIDNFHFDHQLGFAIIGFCSDIGVERNLGRPGSSKGPNSIRMELRNRPCTFQSCVKIYDLGNIIGENGNLEKAQKDLEAAVAIALSHGLFPLVLGGGHAVALGTYMGIHNHIKEKPSVGKLGIVNFDAHFDIRPYVNGGTSGTMFRQIADYCMDHQYHYGYLCMGIQKCSNTVDLFKTAHQLGVSYVLARDIEERSAEKTMIAMQPYLDQHDALYLTICTDVFSAAHAPGVSAPQPLGLYPEKALKLIKYVLQTKKVLGFDIAEVSPRFDHDNTTASLAGVIVYSVIMTLVETQGLEIKFDQ